MARNHYPNPNPINPYDLTRFDPFQAWPHCKLDEDGKNFDIWKIHVNNVIFEAGKIGFFDGTIHRPPDDQLLLQGQFDANVNAIRFFLLNTLSSPVADKLLRLNLSSPPRVMMEHLARNYRPNFIHRLEEWNVLVRQLTQQLGETLEAYCRRAKFVWSVYDSMNLKSSHREYSENFVMVQFVNGLRRHESPRLKETFERIKNMNPPASVDFACELLLSCHRLENGAL